MRVIVIILVLTPLLSCTTHRYPTATSKLELWNQACLSSLGPGISRAEAEKVLQSKDVEYSYVEADKTFYALDKEVGNWRVTYQSAIAIQVQLDPSGRKVENCRAETDYDGL
ncbi:hypothetical protein CWE08_12005 [Aliidiomarina iranensis]|uniref:Lipoprotein n=1 Tax=Aliidiomarina iranensis TaxID=1434071 RepID=A0A432VPM5_9GAMM|nr:hypothetical protein CWE08_12005 [Aliidiomarina iranensis]